MRTLYLGFDTVAINNKVYSEDGLQTLFDLLYPLGVSNFIFLSNFDIASDSFTIINQKNKQLLQWIKENSRRGVNAKICYDVMLSQGISLNKELHRFYANKKSRSLFMSMPTALTNELEFIANDINKLLYKTKAFLIFTGFDKIYEVSSEKTYDTFFRKSNWALGIDLNYLFDPAKISLTQRLIDSSAHFLPMISHDISNYAGALAQSNYYMNTIPKKKYYQLCGQISKTTLHLGY